MVRGPHGEWRPDDPHLAGFYVVKLMVDDGIAEEVVSEEEDERRREEVENQN